MKQSEAYRIADQLEERVFERVEQAQSEWLFEEFRNRMKDASPEDKLLVARALEREDFI